MIHKGLEKDTKLPEKVAKSLAPIDGLKPATKHEDDAIRWVLFFLGNE